MVGLARVGERKQTTATERPILTAVCSLRPSSFSPIPFLSSSSSSRFSRCLRSHCHPSCSCGAASRPFAASPMPMATCSPIPPAILIWLGSSGGGEVGRVASYREGGNTNGKGAHSFLGSLSSPRYFASSVCIAPPVWRRFLWCTVLSGMHFAIWLLEIVLAADFAFWERLLGFLLSKKDLLLLLRTNRIHPARP
jgi:hypothetical protein